MTDLKRKYYRLAGQTLYHREFDNGLKFYYLEKKGFTEMAGFLTVDCGSLDSQYISRRRTRHLPEGIAHFLEHQLFVGEVGEDMSQQFTNLGAESNAFTSFEKTSYFFSGIEHFSECLGILQELVCQPLFTELSIEREKSIIKQEIDMYQDDPEFRLYSGILSSLYPDTLLARDVAGDYTSVESVDLENLTLAYRTFYKPENMTLILVGDLPIKELEQQIADYQQSFISDSDSSFKKKDVLLLPVSKTKTISMDVVKPKLGLGFRGKPHRRGSLIKQRLALRIFLNMVLGWTSSRYQKWYDAGQIDDSLDFEVEVSSRYQFAMITLDTSEPIAMGNRIRQALKKTVIDNHWTEEKLCLVKNEIYGEFIRSLDNLDELANQFMNHLSSRETYFDVPKILKKLSLEDVISIGLKFFEKSESIEFTILPR